MSKGYAFQQADTPKLNLPHEMNIRFSTVSRLNLFYCFKVSFCFEERTRHTAQRLIERSPELSIFGLYSASKINYFNHNLRIKSFILV
jgi:hypothetical protein